jgi:hypothetical protein
VPALEPIVGVRVVANAEAIDAAAWEPTTGTQLWRTAPDEVFAWHADGPPTVTLDDGDAIVEAEHGFVRGRLSPADVEVLRRHVEFALPVELPALVQGKIGGVPARLALLPSGNGVLLVQAAYADELRSRLGW